MAKFERYARLEIYRGSVFSSHTLWKKYDFKSSYDCMNMKFKVEHPSSVKDANKATISVCGMTRDVVSQLTMFSSRVLNQNKYVHVKLFVGYKDDNDLTQIFAGQVIAAKPTQPPDVWLEMECVGDFERKHEYICKYTSKSNKLKQIYEFGSQWMGLSLDWKVQKEGNQITVPNFSYEGAVSDFPRLMNKRYPCVEAFTSLDGKKLVCFDSDSPDCGKGAWIISKDTCMIGVPEPDATGVKLSVFLSVRAEHGLKILLKSDVFPQANGTYVIYDVTHRGEIRGSEWVTDLVCHQPTRFAG